MSSSIEQEATTAPVVTMNRRAAVRTIGGAGAALFALTAVGRMASAAQVSSDSHTSQPYTVTANLNLRAQPNTSAKVLLVIPKGGTITLNAREQNGFYSINYRGTSGWAYASNIVPARSNNPDPVIVGEGKVRANVNLRSGAGTNYRVLRVVKSGSFVFFSNTVRNGFRYVTHQGLAGWISDQYLTLPGHEPPGDPGYDPRYATTTARLNLRAQPNLSTKVLLVIPSGARVNLSGTGSSQFAKVTYKGTTGYAATAYLN